ncbi:hypothetical protein EYF80_018810 [Liparis tanakae]|uniref:Uncharacterized protein n=1 Tax=Liparis tanakae TaxID=230148 RepID=A0A4Z2I138_9TELE|nr:hypothetical protein EYF80_018810 [Liparis tanakae]
MKRTPNSGYKESYERETAKKATPYDSHMRTSAPLTCYPDRLKTLKLGGSKSRGDGVGRGRGGGRRRV